MSELASKKAGTAAGSDDAAAKKAAFLKEAEEAAGGEEAEDKAADRPQPTRTVFIAVARTIAPNQTPELCTPPTNDDNDGYGDDDDCTTDLDMPVQEDKGAVDLRKKAQQIMRRMTKK